ncbi:MAG: hypothetical protein IJG68_01925 [Bacilli bacterium]|nr:hypothetical protein [Bacilli bacterium]
MVIVRFRSGSEAKDTLKKLKKMHKFTKELIECFEEKVEDDDDDDEDYRYDDEEYDRHERVDARRGMGSRGRYRRSM